jgi:hypothetical protein
MSYDSLNSWYRTKSRKRIRKSHAKTTTLRRPDGALNQKAFVLRGRVLNDQPQKIV